MFASLLSLMGSMWVVLCIRDGHTDHYSRSGGGGTVGGVIYKDYKVGARKVSCLARLALQHVRRTGAAS